jgi:hypothetical protein
VHLAETLGHRDPRDHLIATARREQRQLTVQLHPCAIDQARLAAACIASEHDDA